ncbi:AfsR/SARP family transcriptional regulator [Streptomyces odontomachi]|uniref:AfsR/SARP family transcriptional regulator n=1 Tax=Streptomyces odontomachi TaxID=2944940 RepID=UPI00210DA04E|nr:BTAD domain-containing putative transcriptional regulator [Streptomyces sp. ODS25]
MRYEILGVTQARNDQGAPVPVGGTRLRALLTALALRPGRAVTTDTLIGEVWADRPPHDAPAALQALVGRLRRALGKRAIASDQGGYRLVADPDDIDLFQFERLVREGVTAWDRDDAATAAGTLREALRLWRGPALADLPDRVGVATRHETRRLDAVRTRIAADLRLGRAADLIPELTELTTAHPYDEPLHALLLRALRAVGRRADALAAYEKARRTLADGLGTDPGPELRNLHTELLTDGEPERRAGAEPGLAPQQPQQAWTVHTGTASERRTGAEPPQQPEPERQPEAEPGRPVGEPRRPASEPAQRGTEPSHPMAEPGGRAGEPGRPAAEPGQPVAEVTQPALRPGQPAGDPKQPGRPVAGPGQQAAQPGQPPPRPDQPTAPPDQLTRHPNQPPASPGRPSATEPEPYQPSGAEREQPSVTEPYQPSVADFEQNGTRPERNGADPEQNKAEPGQSGARPGRAPAKTVRRGNIRPRLTSFVGREPELDAIRADLHRSRLVTLTGPGGSGKTRLAEEAAARAEDDATAGHAQAWVAELAPLDRPEAVPGAVVSALGLRETVLLAEHAAPQGDPVALLVDYCAPRSLLLVLDNCEHVIDAAAELAETLLTHCPGLTVLATSREPLGVPGESVRPVEPLPPDPAHRLFTERATAVRPDFDPGSDPAAVAEICRRLDGLPLAIELAAARLRLLTPRQIADRLDDRFRLLTSGSRTVLPRQQTLRAVVDWSWELLDETERIVLCEVSVFAGGWDLPSAEAVCTGAVADIIGALVDKSLVVATPVEGPLDGAPGGGGMRYRLLETIHEYATERAAERPALRTAAERRHTAYFHALVEQADPLLRSAAQLAWIQCLEAELDNIRAVLHRALAAGDEESAGSLAVALSWFWWLRNYRQEAARWIERILRLVVPATEPPPTTAPEPAAPHAPDAHLHAPAAPSASGAAPSAAVARPSAPSVDTALLAADPGETEDHPLFWQRMSLRLVYLFLEIDNQPFELFTDDRTRAHITRIREVFGQPVPAAARFPGLLWPFTVFALEGPDAVTSALGAAIANARVHGGAWEAGVLLMFRAHMAIDRSGGIHDVDEYLAELSVLSRRAGDRWMLAQVCSANAEAAMARGRFGEAKSRLEEALRLAHEVGAHAETPFLLARMAEIGYRAGDRGTAIKLLDEADEAADRSGVADIRAYARLLRALLALDEGDTARARTLWNASREEAARGTPPPQFTVLLNSVESRVTAAESGPTAGLSVLSDTLYEAMVHRCAESVLAGLVDCAAALVAALGDHPCAARLLGAATAWRGDHPRPQPDRVLADTAEQQASAALGADRYRAELAAGASLAPEDTLAELSTVLGIDPPPPVPDTAPPWPPST